MAEAAIDSDWYNDPKYYDMVFSLGTADEVAFLTEVHKRFGVARGRRVLEPACGSGRLVVGMAQAGFAVRGFDLSRPMLRYARAQLTAHELRGQLVQADMTDFTVPKPVHLAHCLVSTFKYLLDESAAQSHLACVARALVPGGIYVLGFHLSDYTDGHSSRERWCAREKSCVVRCVISSTPAVRRTRREEVTSRMRIREGKKQFVMRTTWDFRTYNAAQVRSLLRKVPELELVACYDFGYDIDVPRVLDDEQLDVVLILRRR